MTASLEALAAHRREISEIASTLRAMLSPDQLQIRSIAQVAKRLLCDLCGRVAKHLIEEDEDLYPSLLAHGDMRIQHMAWGFQASDRPLRRKFEAYHQRWLKDCDFDFTDQVIELGHRFAGGAEAIVEKFIDDQLAVFGFVRIPHQVGGEVMAETIASPVAR